MKKIRRSKRIRLLLLGSISAGSLVGCSHPAKPVISADHVYTNDYFVAGVGYYHAPFNAWYPLPYNHFDPLKRRYYYGGQWGADPYMSIVNVSSPSPHTAGTTEARRTDVPRGGFGCTAGPGGFYHTYS